jgi:hypothetical protein
MTTGSGRPAGPPVPAAVFTAPASDRERYHYGWSVVACLPGGMGIAARPPPER